MRKRSLLQWADDTYYGATKFPWALVNPRIVLGRFSPDENGDLQKIYFEELLRQGFKRTIWQLVFPQQTAGLIKKIPIQEDGTNEYHVRFYGDGLIDCELEVDRLSTAHWVGPRKHGTYLMEELLDQSEIELKMRERIRALFGERDYSVYCTRNPGYNPGV